MFAGGCGVLVGHPLNTIKTWQQATNSRIGTSMYEIIVRNNGVSDETIQNNNIGYLTGNTSFPINFLFIY